MIETVDTPLDTRLEVLPSGIRLVRLEPGEGAWLAEYRQILLIAAQDFLTRARLPGTPHGVLGRLAYAVDDANQAVWLVLDPGYRLIGFAWMTLASPFGGPPVATSPATYLYSRKSPRGVFPALVRRMVDWARSQGATNCYFETKRARPRAWARIQARAASTIFEVAMGDDDGIRQ